MKHKLVFAWFSTHCGPHRYCYKIPEKYPLALAAPLLCAGITVYTPLIHHKMNEPGKSIGVIGLGGLGHLAVKFAKAFGLTVTIFSTSISKKDDALNLLKADNFVISSDKDQMAVRLTAIESLSFSSWVLYQIHTISGFLKSSVFCTGFVENSGLHSRHSIWRPPIWSIPTIA